MNNVTVVKADGTKEIYKKAEFRIHDGVLEIQQWVANGYTSQLTTVAAYGTWDNCYYGERS